jgi:hypothetical protein
MRFQPFPHFALAKPNLPAIIWCFVSRTRLTSTQEVDVSVSAVRHRAFVFEAPQDFATDNRASKCTEPFLLVRFGRARRLQQMFLPLL